MMPRAGAVLCRPSLLSETIDSETVVAAIASPHMIEMLNSAQKNQAIP